MDIGNYSNIIVYIYMYLYSNDDPYGLIRINELKNKSLFLRKSNSDPIHSVSATYKDSQGNIGQLKFTQIENRWYTEWEDEVGEPVEILKDTVLEIIQEIFSDYSLITFKEK